jgi:streptogrisin C
LKQRKTTAWVTAGFVAAGATLTVGATVLAVTASSDTTDAAGSGGGAVVMAAMQRDLSLTADESSARLKKEAWAAGTERTLRTELKDEFAGAWMTAKGTDFTVAVTTDAAAATVQAAGATPKLVERSESQLTALKARLDATKTTNSAVTGWYVDPKTNSVTVVARAGKKAAARELAAAGGVPADAVRVVSTKATPRLMAEIKGGDEYFIDGQFRCSVGFAVEGGFVTAGHCGAVGATTAGADQAPQGEVAASTFPGTADAGFVEVNANQELQPVVATEDGDIPVAGSEEAVVGAAICRTGSTTGTRCGEVLAKNQTVVYPEGAVSGLTRTNVCAEGGDSGGPWMSDDQAQGVTSGGSGDCGANVALAETFFQPLAEILDTNNLTLLTTGAQAPPTTEPGATAPPTTEPPADEPPATDPPATEPPATEPPADEPPAADPPAAEPPAGACPETEKTLKGNLASADSRQVANFRAHSGTHNACLTPPAGADFDLSLQRWNGTSWRTVAKAAGDTSSEQLTFTGRGGRYRYSVSSAEGSGAYVLGVDVP